jgi:20S proteasome alpha/beta subunit
MTSPPSLPLRTPAPSSRSPAPGSSPRCPTAAIALERPHGTTVRRLRYADGVVMAGDRRATSGNLISHRSIEKVFPADRTRRRHRRCRRARPSRWCKLFQLQLEHYEKVEGSRSASRARPTSSAMMVRKPARRDAGPGRGAALRRVRPAARHRPPVPVRRHRRPLRGVRPRRHGLGQPARRHRREARLPRRPQPRRRRSTSPSRRCSRPPTRTPPPAAPTSARHLPGGRHDHRRRVRTGSTTPSSRRATASCSTASANAARRCASDEHAVLRRTRTGDEGPRGLRAQGHRPRPQRSSPSPTPTASCSVPRTRPTPCASSRRSTTASPSRGWASTTSSTSSASPVCATRTSRATPTRAKTSTPAASPTSTPRYLGQIFTHEMKPLEVEILVAEVSEAPDDQLFHLLYDGTMMDEKRFVVLGGDSEAISERLEGQWQEGGTLAHALACAVRALAGPERTLSPDDLEVAVLARGNSRRCFKRSPTLAALPTCRARSPSLRHPPTRRPIAGHTRELSAGPMGPGRSQRRHRRRASAVGRSATTTGLLAGHLVGERGVRVPCRRRPTIMRGVCAVAARARRRRRCAGELPRPRPDSAAGSSTSIRPS